jgi:hypothetical protein
MDVLTRLKAVNTGKRKLSRRGASFHHIDRGGPEKRQSPRAPLLSQSRPNRSAAGSPRAPLSSPGAPHTGPAQWPAGCLALLPMTQILIRPRVDPPSLHWAGAYITPPPLNSLALLPMTQILIRPRVDPPVHLHTLGWIHCWNGTGGSRGRGRRAGHLPRRVPLMDLPQREPRFPPTNEGSYPDRKPRPATRGPPASALKTALPDLPWERLDVNGGRHKVIVGSTGVPLKVE